MNASLPTGIKNIAANIATIQSSILISLLASITYNPNALRTSVSDGTRPLLLTTSSTTMAGVDITLYFIISIISSIFVIVASIPDSATTFSTTDCVVLHLAQPVPNILITIISFV